MFDPHRGYLPHLKKHDSESHVIKNTVMKHNKVLNVDLKSEHKKATNRTTICPATAIWNRLRKAPSFCLRTDPSSRIKKRSKIIKTQPCMQFVAEYPCYNPFFIASESLFICFSIFIDKVAIRFRFQQTFLQKCFQTNIFGH